MADGAALAAGTDRDQVSLRRTTVWTVALVGWSLFVWGGRIRNTLTDDSLSGTDRVGPQLLALSFVIPAIALVGLLLRRRQQPTNPGRVRSFAIWLRVFASWTAVVWVVRAGDIALAGDHELGFVLVHLVLAVVSVALAAGAVVSEHSSHGARREAVGAP